MALGAFDDREDRHGDVAADAAQTAHGAAVERVVAAMRERTGEALTLRDMADIAYLSPAYFTRVFHSATGLPPAEYFAALRVQEAKRLLLAEGASVTDACYAVGYTGLGTFTARFARLVGVPPGRLRRQAAEVDGIVAAAQPFGGVSGGTGITGVRGVISAPDATPGLIFIGLFPSPIPQATPIGSALLEGPGAYHIPYVPDGRYYAMAAAFPAATRGMAYLLPEDGLRVGAARAVVTVRGGRTCGPADIEVRPPRPTDPPLLVALPFLLVGQRRQE